MDRNGEMEIWTLIDLKLEDPSKMRAKELSSAFHINLNAMCGILRNYELDDNITNYNAYRERLNAIVSWIQTAGDLVYADTGNPRLTQPQWDWAVRTCRMYNAIDSKKSAFADYKMLERTYRPLMSSLEKGVASVDKMKARRCVGEAIKLKGMVQRGEILKHVKEETRNDVCGRCDAILTVYNNKHALSEERKRIIENIEDPAGKHIMYDGEEVVIPNDVWENDELDIDTKVMVAWSRMKHARKDEPKEDEKPLVRKVNYSEYRDEISRSEPDALKMRIHHLINKAHREKIKVNISQSPASCENALRCLNDSKERFRICITHYSGGDRQTLIDEWKQRVIHYEGDTALDNLDPGQDCKFNLNGTQLMIETGAYGMEDFFKHLHEKEAEFMSKVDDGEIMDMEAARTFFGKFFQYTKLPEMFIRTGPE